MELAGPQLASLALTHVYYDPQDIFGLPSAILALVPQAIIVAYVVAIFTRREVETCFCFGGQLICEALNWVLKRLIKQDRPQHVIGAGKGYGMPSSHAQFMGYFAIYAVVWLGIRCRNGDRYWNLLRKASIVVTAAAVCVSRVYLTYHTGSQVLLGVCVGLVFGIAWFSLFEVSRTHGLVDWILDLKIARYFLLKDTTIDEGLRDEWHRWHERRTKSHKAH